MDTTLDVIRTHKHLPKLKVSVNGTRQLHRHKFQGFFRHPSSGQSPRAVERGIVKHGVHNKNAPMPSPGTGDLGRTDWTLSNSRCPGARVPESHKTHHTKQMHSSDVIGMPGLPSYRLSCFDADPSHGRSQLSKQCVRKPHPCKTGMARHWKHTHDSNHKAGSSWAKSS
jgi:hypothetical protein